MNDIVLRLGEILIEKEETVSVAESVTGGYVQYLLSTCPKAQQFFQGGLTAFNVGQKTLHLGVNPITAAVNNAVSIPVASRMAEAIAISFISEWSVGITGFATVPEFDTHPYPYCFYSIWYKGKEIITLELEAPDIPRAEVEKFFASMILEKLLETMKVVYQGSL